MNDLYRQSSVERAETTLGNENVSQPATEAIAVIGTGCRFPGGCSDLEKYWAFILSGKDAVAQIPPSRWSLGRYYDPDPAVRGKSYSKWGAFLEHVEEFDAEFFKIPIREAIQIDPQQRILLEVVWEALQDSGLLDRRLDASNTGVFLGICNSDYSQMQFSEVDHIDAYTGTGNSLSVAAGRISYLLNLQGPSIAIDTACSSSLVAVHLACRSLKYGECDLAVAGGVSLMLAPHSMIIASKMNILSRRGRC